MSEHDQRSSESMIRITREEALDSHVDDLLQRQQSLRGDAGIVRTREKKWYYQNWFVFMLSGAIAAFLAWALIEPLFDDQFYVQGTLEALDHLYSAPSIQGPDDGEYRLELGGGMYGIRIRGDKIWLFTDTKDLQGDGSRIPLDPDLIDVGDVIGVYVEMSEDTYGLPVGVLVDRNPPAKPSAKSQLPLEQLAARTNAGGMLLFPLVAGFVGMLIGAVDGIICRLLRRALLGGIVGLLVGLLGGFVMHLVASLVYSPLSDLASQQRGDNAGSLSTLGFLIQMGGRSFSWALAGMAMGLGQGVALRSRRLFLYGFLGGTLGGLIGGLLFDPIDFFLFGGPDKPGANMSRLIGIVVIGASVGAMIGIVERMARDAWLRMTEGPLAGKEFVIFKDVMRLGASPRSEIYLFNDPQVAGNHAIIRSVADECEIEHADCDYLVLLNDRPVERARLRHGDVVTLGKTSFLFQKRKN